MSKDLSFEEVYSYAEGQLNYHISKMAKDFPREHQEEMRQDAMLRIWRKFKDIDKEKGWKSLVGTICFGAVIDYLRAGRGFKEVSKDCVHVGLLDDDGNGLSAEDIAGVNGEYVLQEDVDKINWDRLGMLSAYDEEVHLLSKLLAGFSITELCKIFKISQKDLLLRQFVLFQKIKSGAYKTNKLLSEAISCAKLGISFSNFDKLDESIKGVDVLSWEESNLAARQVQTSMGF